MAATTQERRSPGGASPVVPLLPWLAGGAFALALLAALLIAVIPGLGFATRSAALNVGIETAASLIAGLAAYLVLGRYMLSRSLRDLALVGALTLLALTNAAFSALPALLDEDPGRFTTWAPVGGRLLAALGFAAAAGLPDLRLGSPRRAGAAMLALAAALLVAVAGLVELLGTSLPGAGEIGPPPGDSDTPDLGAPGGFLALQLLTMGLYAAAAVGFTARARRSRDELIAWFAIGSSVAAASRLHYFLFPAVNPDWVFSGDVVRLCFYLALLVGALREIRRYQRSLALAAVLDERRRMARDLHDGLAQELAFITTQTRRLEGSLDPERAARVAAAAERALDESRGAITALTRSPEDPFDAEVSQVAEQLTARVGARLRLDLDPRATVAEQHRDQLLRILREAVTNGLRHGDARVIAVKLTGGERVRLAIRDDGTGFDPEDARNGGFGLTSMRERAAAIGGELTISSRLGEGTEVEVVVR
jgi:signal transduction histidine kinase